MFNTRLAIGFLFLLLAGVAWGSPLVIDNGFVCPTREAAMKVVEYEQSIASGDAKVTAEEYDRHTQEFGCGTIFGAAVEKHEEVLRYTGVYPSDGTWSSVDVIIIRGTIRRLDLPKGIEGFIFLPASVRFPGEAAI